MVGKTLRDTGVFRPGTGFLTGIFLATLVPGWIHLSGQDSPFDPGMYEEAARIREKVVCLTDRSLYICGEPIRFRAVIRGNAPADRGPWSTVLYAELVSPAGDRLAQGKYRIMDQVATGEIRIPDHLITGCYYLRSYTRWMRNWGPGAFSYVPIRIINPERSEQLGEVAQGTEIISLMPAQRIAESLQFESHPEFYDREEGVRLNLLAPGAGLPDTIRGCVTVVPHSIRPNVQMVAEQIPDRDSSGGFMLNFLPDRNGPSLSGAVIYREPSGETPSPARIHFTLMGDVPGYFVCRSDATGRFIVGLPALYGELELFVQPETSGSDPVELRIDQDFDPRPIRLPYIPLRFSDEEVEAATIMSRNVQLARIYTGSSPGPERTASGPAVPFYGSPTRSVDLDEYVLLPTLDEVFLNLVPSVTPATRRSRTTLRIQSENPSLSLYEPLVMVDEVPVLDMEEFMSISPARIRRVDVIEDVYVKGDLRFGGIINLRSRDRDMAGMDLPPSSFFFDYQALSPVTSESQNQGSPEDRIPDLRNTLLWVPDTRIVEGFPSGISFRAPDYPGNYTVLFRGEDAGGRYFIAETTFTVR